MANTLLVSLAPRCTSIDVNSFTHAFCRFATCCIDDTLSCPW